MEQQAIDAVREDGQYQAIKYLFEMIGLYPAASQDESPMQESLARTLLDHCGGWTLPRRQIRWTKMNHSPLSRRMRKHR